MWSTMWLRHRIENTLGRGRRNGSPRANRTSDIVAFVGKGAKMRGTLHYVGTMRIDGQVHGEIQAHGLLVVGQEAVVHATIDADSVVSQGTLGGNIVARKRVQLQAPTVLAGSVKAPRVVVEDGVRFEGDCRLEQTRPSIPQRDVAADPPSLQASNL